MPTDIEDGKESREGSLQIVRSIWSYFEGFGEVLESDRQVVELLACRGWEDLSESIFDRLDHRHESIKDVLDAIDEEGPTSEILPIAQNLIASISRSADKTTNSSRKASKEGFGFTKISEDYLPGLSPTGAYRFFRRVQQLRQGLDLSSSIQSHLGLRLDSLDLSIVESLGLQLGIGQIAGELLERVSSGPLTSARILHPAWH